VTPPSVRATASQEGPRPDPAEIARVLGLPLPQLDRLVEVRAPWSPVTLWFVPGEAQAEELLADGVSWGRIWTAGELLASLTGHPGLESPMTRLTRLTRFSRH
jgi:hypothetical protein